MTEYERGYTDGYKDGLHKYMPEVPSIPIPQIAAERQARIDALEQAREKIAKYVILGPRVYELTEWGKGQDVGFRKVVENLDALIAAERERLPGAGETIDPYAMHICDTCDSESGMECTRRNCHLNNAWHPRHTEHAKPEPGDVVAVCESCGQHLSLNEIEPYRAGYCHAVPNGDPETDEMWPEPCGPVYIWRAAEVRARIEGAK